MALFETKRKKLVPHTLAPKIDCHRRVLLKPRSFKSNNTGIFAVQYQFSLTHDISILKNVRWNARWDKKAVAVRKKTDPFKDWTKWWIAIHWNAKHVACNWPEIAHRTVGAHLKLKVDYNAIENYLNMYTVRIPYYQPTCNLSRFREFPIKTWSFMGNLKSRLIAPR